MADPQLGGHVSDLLSRVQGGCERAEQMQPATHHRLGKTETRGGHGSTLLRLRGGGGRQESGVADSVFLLQEKHVCKCLVGVPAHISPSMERIGIVQVSPVHDEPQAAVREHELEDFCLDRLACRGRPSARKPSPIGATDLAGHKVNQRLDAFEIGEVQD